MNHIEIAERLWEHGFSAYTVGGAVRDMFHSDNENIVHDFDIATRATPDDIISLFKDRTVKLVGKSFGVVIIDGIEVATFRKDAYSDIKLRDAKKCEVTFSETIEHDLERRDFTINALALCEKTGEIIDLHNGINDIKNCVIRFVGNSHKRIMEDPNRIIRACRFLAKVEGTFAPETFEALASHAYLIEKYVAPERIRLEIIKAMEYEHPSLFFSALHSIGALQYIFPEMVSCVDHLHGNHHAENVWEHMMLSGDHISSKFPLIRLASFLHDIGKPASFNKTDGTFLAHESFGKKILETRLENLKFSKDEISLITGLVRHHMYSTWKISPRAVRKIKKKLFDDNINVHDWLRIKVADRIGNINKEHWTFSHFREISELFLKDVHIDSGFDVKSLAISGGELIKIFDLTPGLIVGNLQKHLLNFIIEEGFEYNTVDILLNESKKFLEESDERIYCKSS